MSIKWDTRFLTMAELVASWSKDPSTKCGAVIVRPDRTVASVGFNGFPRGMDDDGELYAQRAVKYSRVVHAEMNAILSAKEPVRGYTLYTYPHGLAPTCERCAVHVIQAGITRVVHWWADTEMSRRWSPETSLSFYREAGVEVVALVKENGYVLRRR